MEPSVAHTLANATSAFYQANAQSFSLTRQAAWPGWKQVMADVKISDRSKMRVLDVACGNLRFERFLARTWPAVDFDFYAVDNCNALMPAPGTAPKVTFARVNVVDALIDAGCSDEPTTGTPFGEPCNEHFDLAVCFGFMHHVPTFEARLRLLKELVGSLAPGGFAAVSFWRFMGNERLAGKATAATPLALEQLGLHARDLDENDYLLGWQDETSSWRYCHHFDDDEVDRLVEASNAHLVDRFRSDGRTGDLNEYLVLQRKDHRG